MDRILHPEAKRARTQAAQEVSDDIVCELLSVLPPYNRYTTYRVRALSDASPVAEFLKRRLLASMAQHRRSLQNRGLRELPSIQVERIEEVFNPRLLEKHTLELQHMMGLSRAGSSNNISQEHGIVLKASYGVNLNEVLLYHGAKDIDLICEAGFDPRRGGQTAGRMFGCGSYFAENFSKADLYAGPQPFVSNHEPMCVLIVRVALGEAYAAEQSLPAIMLPPQRAAELQSEIPL